MILKIFVWGAEKGTKLVYIRGVAVIKTDLIIKGQIEEFDYDIEWSMELGNIDGFWGYRGI